MASNFTHHIRLCWPVLAHLADVITEPVKLLMFLKLRTPKMEKKLLRKICVWGSDFSDILACLKSHDTGLLTGESGVITCSDYLAAEGVSRCNKPKTGNGSLRHQASRQHPLL